MNKFYWFKRGGFVLAVDAISRQDAMNYVKAWNGDMEYMGYYEQGTQYTTACNGVTTKRQEEITRNLHRQRYETEFEWIFTNITTQTRNT